MSAAESKGCCPVGSEPLLATDYKPIGEVTEVGEGLDAYVSGNAKHGVILASDIWGFAAGRVRLIADQIADAGFTVVAPRLLGSEFGTDNDGWDPARPLSGDGNRDAMMAWVKGFPWEGDIKVKLDTSISYLKQRGVESIGMIGFCFGAWVIFHESAEGRIACGVSCHPSVRLEGLHGSNEVELAKHIKCPQLILPAGNDPDNVKPGGEVIKVLESNGVEHTVREFPDMTHGWVPRSDLSKPEAKRDVKLAMEMAIEFLKKHVCA